MWYQNIIVKNRLINKVLRDTARAPQPPTKQPAGHLISQQGLYVPNKAYFGAKMAVFGPNILIQPALGLLLTDSGVWGKTFWRVGWFFFLQKLNPETKSRKIDCKVGNEPSFRGLQTGRWQNLGSYGKKQIFGPKTEFSGPKKTFTFRLEPLATTGRSCAKK